MFPKQKERKTGYSSWCHECFCSASKEWYRKNKQKKQSYDKRRRQKPEIKQRRNDWEKQYKKENLNYEVACALRSRLNKAIRTRPKGGSAVRDLGCTIEELISHLEQNFQPGMTWNNRGLGGGGNGKSEWQIDHIIPLHKSDLANQEQFLKACHYTNLQPLWAEDNNKKK